MPTKSTPDERAEKAYVRRILPPTGGLTDTNYRASRELLLLGPLGTTARRTGTPSLRSDGRTDAKHRDDDDATGQVPALRNTTLIERDESVETCLLMQMVFFSARRGTSGFCEAKDSISELSRVAAETQSISSGYPHSESLAFEQPRFISYLVTPGE